MSQHDEMRQFSANVASVCRSFVAVVDVVIQRGGFRGEEILAIGQLREQSNRLIEQAENMEFDDEDED